VRRSLRLPPSEREWGERTINGDAIKGAIKGGAIKAMKGDANLFVCCPAVNKRGIKGDANLFMLKGCVPFSPKSSRTPGSTGGRAAAGATRAATKPPLRTGASVSAPFSRARQRSACAHQLCSGKSDTPLACAHCLPLSPEALQASTCSKHRNICSQSMTTSPLSRLQWTQGSQLQGGSDRWDRGTLTAHGNGSCITLKVTPNFDARLARSATRAPPSARP
jgi:hypothetical protein